MNRKMGFWMCTSLVMGNMIGSGVLLLPSALAPYGAISIAGWVIASLGAICLALMFASLVRIEPSAGGPYAYTRRGYGEFAAYLCSWCYWKAAWIGNTAIAVTMVGYLRVFFPQLQNPIMGWLVGVSVIWFFTLVNLKGTKTAGSFAIVMTGLKLLPLLLVSILGWFFADFHNLTQIPILASPNHGGGESMFAMIAGAGALTMWSFTGLESATVPADDVDQPEKTIPRATIIGTILTAIIYIASVTAIQAMIPADKLANSTAPFADAASMILGPVGYYLVAAGAVIACMGTLNGWILLQGQIPMAAARDGLFPRSLANLNKNGVPARSLIISSILITVMMIFDFNENLVGMFNIMALLGTLTVIIPYAFCACAKLQIMADDPHLFTKRQSRTGAIIAICGFLYSLWAIYGAGMEAGYWTLILLIAGIPLYTWRKWRNRVESERAAKVALE